MKNQLALVWVMACVAAGFFLVLKVGFLLSHTTTPPPINSVQLTLVAVFVLGTGLVAATALAVRSSKETVRGVRLRREARASAAKYTEARRLRVLELAADPARAKYAPLVERGEDWSDVNIAYDQHPDRTVTCLHLQAIEHALRQAGIPVRRFRYTEVSATCCIAFDGLQRDFKAAPPVRYAEFYAGERSEYDHPMAFLICDEHKAAIHTIHPEASEAKNASWFPLKNP